MAFEDPMIRRPEYARKNDGCGTVVDFYWECQPWACESRRQYLVRVSNMTLDVLPKTIRGVGKFKTGWFPCDPHILVWDDLDRSFTSLHSMSEEDTKEILEFAFDFVGAEF